MPFKTASIEINTLKTGDKEMDQQKGSLLYEGKAKCIYEVVGHPQLVIQEFKDSLTAFNGEKKDILPGKGQINVQIAGHFFQYLENKGIKTHFISHTENMLLTHKLKMIPLEVVVRNYVAGSLKKRLGLQEGLLLSPPLMELYFKSDPLKDPLINEAHALLLKTTDQTTLNQLKALALQINQHLICLLDSKGLQLVDFKLEFGKDKNGEVLLADEITPDTCRIWEGTEKLDKDRFRFDLGDVKKGYQRIQQQLIST